MRYHFKPEALSVMVAESTINTPASEALTCRTTFAVVFGFSRIFTFSPVTVARNGSPAQHVVERITMATDNKRKNPVFFNVKHLLFREFYKSYRCCHCVVHGAVADALKGCLGLLAPKHPSVGRFVYFTTTSVGALSLCTLSPRWIFLPLANLRTFAVEKACCTSRI